MSKNDYIHIKNNQVNLNGELFFKQETHSLSAFLSDSYKHIGLTYPKFHKMDSLCKLGIIASEILLQKNDITKKYDLDKIGIVISNAASSIDTDRQHQLSINDKSNYFPSPAVFVYTLPNIVIGEIAIKHKITGENAFLISERFNPKQLINYSHSLFNENTDALLLGWLEADAEKQEAFLFIMEKGNDYDFHQIEKACENL